MPVAALAATLLLALPAADAVAGAPSPHSPEPAPAVPRQAAAAEASLPIQHATAPGEEPFRLTDAGGQDSSRPAEAGGQDLIRMADAVADPVIRLVQPGAPDRLQRTAALGPDRAWGGGPDRVWGGGPDRAWGGGADGRWGGGAMAKGAIHLVALDGLTATGRPAKTTPAMPKGPQLANLGPTQTGKPGAKPQRASAPSRQAQPRPQPSRPAARATASRGPQHPPPAARADGDAPPSAARAPHLVGVASYYARRFNGRLMANGQRFDPGSDSIAHRTLPFGTRVRIVNMTNGRTVFGTVRDRGPFTRGRLLDVSPRIAQDLGMMHAGIARVAVWRDGHEAVEIAEAP
jgi:rare lipoprotein A